MFQFFAGFLYLSTVCQIATVELTSCQSVKLTSNSTNSYENCKEITEGLAISGLKLEVPDLLKTTKITGKLVVQNTNFKDLSFLENLKEIELGSENTSPQDISIDIRDNFKMKRLGLKSLQAMFHKFLNNFIICFQKLTNPNRAKFNVNLLMLHDTFCLTVEEIMFFLDHDANFINIEANFCKNVTSHSVVSSNSRKLCVFETMAKLEDNCVIIFGSLLIDHGDEGYVEKLKNVTHVLGSLAVQNTNLENCKFLENLQRVVTLDELATIMEFSQNKKLQNCQLPNVKNFVIRGRGEILVQDNHPNFFETLVDCTEVEKRTNIVILYNGDLCSSINPPITPSPTIGPTMRSFEEYEEGNISDIDGAWYNFSIFWLHVTGYTAMVALLFNIFHLIILFQKELRENFIFVLMIGIAFSDVFLVASYIVEYLLEFDVIYKKSSCGGFMYFHELIIYILKPIREIMRKSSTFFSLFMAILRTCSLLFTMSPTMKSFTKPSLAWILILVIFTLSAVSESSKYMFCNFDVYTYDYCAEYPNIKDAPYQSYLISCRFADDNTSAVQYWLKSNGWYTIAFALFYLITTIILLFQVRSVNKRRKNLNRENEKTEFTSVLIASLAVTQFITGICFGVWDAANENLYRVFNWMIFARKWGEEYLWFIVAVNSLVHCVICFGLSSQYRSVIVKFFKKGS